MLSCDRFEELVYGKGDFVPESRGGRIEHAEGPFLQNGAADRGGYGHIIQEEGPEYKTRRGKKSVYFENI